MQTNKKILFTDLDGTLLNDEKNITPGNQNAIHEALEAGHIIVITTGRPLSGSLAAARRLGLTREGCYAITFNGGLIFDLYRNRTIFSRTIPRTLVRQAFDLAARRQIHIQTYNATHVIAEHDNQFLRDYSELTRIPRMTVPDIVAALDDEPCKMLAISYGREEDMDAFRQDLLSAFHGQLDCFFSNSEYLEIVPAEVSKGFAVRWMCTHLGIPLENSVAAGDAQNDISMLEAAHIGAVMCNAFAGVAQHGNYITKADNNHDGVAEIIRKFIL